LVLILGVTSNVFMVAVSLFFARKVFLGKPSTYGKTPDEKGAAFLIGPGILVLLSLVLGLFPGNLGTLVIKPALNVVSIEMMDVKLKIWHGFNEVLFLSLLTILLGVALYWAMLKKKMLLDTWRKVNSVIFSIELDEVFAWMMDKFVKVAQFKTKTVQHGYHRYYILTIIVFTSLLLWFQVFVIRSWEIGMSFSLKPFYISGLALVILGAAITSAISSSRILTIISMGVAGYGISLIFMYYSAIDLAITQILVETLTVVMFMAILQKLPRFAVLSSKRTRLRDFIIALSFGAVMTILAIKAVNVNLNPTISDFFVENSYTRAFGENIVNVILVDFRALDTLGEVTVLTIAATGVFLLLKTNNKKL
jgi:multicomponent Na+:H+ antiporter subunit A